MINIIDKLVIVETPHVKLRGEVIAYDGNSRITLGVGILTDDGPFDEIHIIHSDEIHITLLELKAL